MESKRLIRWGIIIVFVYLIVTTLSGIFDLWRSGDKLTTRENSLKTLQKERENLLRQKAIVQSPGYLEKVARNELGMSRPGEEIIIIPKDLLADNSPTATPDATPNWQKWLKLLF